MRDVWHTRKVLGINIIFNRKWSGLFFSQEGYVDKVHNKFETISSKSVTTPLDQNFKLFVTQSYKD